MFSMTKNRVLDEGQSRYVDVNKRHYGEDAKFYQKYIFFLGYVRFNQVWLRLIRFSLVMGKFAVSTNTPHVTINCLRV